MTSDQSSRIWCPLAGTRVVDFSALLPGPFISTVLADLGASVVKVEPPGGDSARSYQPAMFAAVNRGKRSLALDLKDPSAEPIVARLAGWADVVIESSRPGVADRLGIGYATLSALNPRIVYCSVSSFGQSGPARDRPAHDINIMAAAGALGLPGHWSRPPSRPSIPVGDFAAGALAAASITAALAERDRTGHGRHLDASLFGAVLYCAGLRHGTEPQQDPRAHLSPANDIYRTADNRWIALGLMEDHFWRRFRAAVATQPSGQAAEALSDPAFDSHSGRQEHGDRLAGLLAEVIAGDSADRWIARLTEADVPADICRLPHEAAASPQAEALGLSVTGPDGRQVGFPVRAAGRTSPLHAPAPALNGDAEAILAEIGAGSAAPTPSKFPPHGGPA